MDFFKSLLDTWNEFDLSIKIAAIGLFIALLGWLIPNPVKTFLKSLRKVKILISSDFFNTQGIPVHTILKARLKVEIINPKNVHCTITEIYLKSKKAVIGNLKPNPSVSEIYSGPAKGKYYFASIGNNKLPYKLGDYISFDLDINDEKYLTQLHDKKVRLIAKTHQNSLLKSNAIRISFG